MKTLFVFPAASVSVCSSGFVIHVPLTMYCIRQDGISLLHPRGEWEVAHLVRDLGVVRELLGVVWNQQCCLAISGSLVLHPHSSGCSMTEMAFLCFLEHGRRTRLEKQERSPLTTVAMKYRLGILVILMAFLRVCASASLSFELHFHPSTHGCQSLNEPVR